MGTWKKAKYVVICYCRLFRNPCHKIKYKKTSGKRKKLVKTCEELATFFLHKDKWLILSLVCKDDNIVYSMHVYWLCKDILQLSFFCMHLISIRTYFFMMVRMVKGECCCSALNVKEYWKQVDICRKTLIFHEHM